MAELAVGVAPLPPATAWRRALRHPSFAIGGALVLLLLATAALSWVWTPYPAAEIDIAHRPRAAERDPLARHRRLRPRRRCRC
jgi:peptide/nickel transport system permease protein